jgi:hypothetical protein
MRSWESKDIIDILVDHHKDLLDHSEVVGRKALGQDLFYHESEKLDDKCIVIENFLEETFGIEWKGQHFSDTHGNQI